MQVLLRLKDETCKLLYIDVKSYRCAGVYKNKEKTIFESQNGILKAM